MNTSMGSVYTERMVPDEELRNRLNARLRQYDDQLRAIRAHFLRKNLQYGDAVGSTGVRGSATEFVGIASRLSRMVLSSPECPQEEDLKKILEIFRDAANYSIFGAMFCQSGNWSGEGKPDLSWITTKDLENELRTRKDATK